MVQASRLKQHYRYQFSICIDSINKASVVHNDKLHIAWNSPSNKGRLTTLSLSVDDASTQNIRLWWNQQVQFEETLTMDVESQAFEPCPLQLLLRKEKPNMTSTLGEFKINLGDYANMVFAENIISTDIPARNFEFVKAHVTVQFRLVEKSNMEDVEVVETLNTTNSIKDLKDEIARVASECAELKQMFIDSQTFAKSDYWIEKIPEMELNFRQYATKVEDLNSHLHKMLEETKISIMDERICDLQAKMFVDEEKLRRLSDIYNAFTQSTTQELTKMKDRIERTDKYSITTMQEESTIMIRPILKASSHNIRPNSPRPSSSLSVPNSPRPSSSLSIPNFEIVNNNYNNSNNSSNNINERGRCDSPVPTVHNSETNFESKYKFSLMEDVKVRLDRLEPEIQQLWPRLALDEADLQQLHMNAEELRWEREKYMENFYLFQKSQAQIAEELAKLKLQIDESNYLPRKLEQRVDFLESQNVRMKRMVAGKKFSCIEEWNDARSRSTPILNSRSPTPISPRSPNMRQPTTFQGPPYQWFLLDHCFLFASGRDPSEDQIGGDLLVPAYFLIKFCSTNLDLAKRREDWTVFDALFFALHFEVKKHSKSAPHLLFWLANSCFILDQLNNNVFTNTNLLDSSYPGVAENGQKVTSDLEGFVKSIYLTFATFIANEFESAINNFPLCNIGDYENEWVTTIIAKLEWLYTLLKSYKFEDSFMQHVVGDVYGLMDASLFNLLCSESYLCSPGRANQVKYFVSSLEDWACSEHPTFAAVIDNLCHVREAANLILAPKANLKEASFRHCLFPNLTDIQVKHLLTIFLPETSSEKLPPTLLSHLTTQIAYSTSPPSFSSSPSSSSSSSSLSSSDSDIPCITISFALGNFFVEKQLSLSVSEPIPGRFTPPLIGETSACCGFTNIVNSTMEDIEASLSCDAYSHWRFLSQEIDKW